MAELKEVTDKPVTETLRERATRLHHWLLQETYSDILENHQEQRDAKWEKFLLEKGPFAPPSPEDMIWLINTSLAAVGVADSLEENLPKIPLTGRYMTGRKLCEWAVQTIRLEPTEKAKLALVPRIVIP